jgi:hypothetical protein
MWLDGLALLLSRPLVNTPVLARLFFCILGVNTHAWLVSLIRCVRSPFSLSVFLSMRVVESSFKYHTFVRDRTVSNIAELCLYVAPSTCLFESIKRRAMTGSAGRHSISLTPGSISALATAESRAPLPGDAAAFRAIWRQQRESPGFSR